MLIAAPAAATDQDTFTTLIAAVAPPIGQKFKPKVACACPNNGVTLATAGFVMTDLFGKVRCGLPTSTPTEPWGWSRSPTTSRCSATEPFFLPDRQDGACNAFALQDRIVSYVPCHPPPLM